MDFLLETIGFPPGPGSSAWMQRQARRGGPRRIPVAPGVAVRVERGELDQAAALWPSLTDGPVLRLEDPGLEPPARIAGAVLGAASTAEPAERLCSGVETRRPALVFGKLWMPPRTGLPPAGAGDPVRLPTSGHAPDAAAPGQPRRGRAPRIAAYLDPEPGPTASAGQREMQPLSTRGLFQLGGFALDVEAIGRRPQHPGRLEPLAGPLAPLGCAALELEIARVQRLANRVTGRLFERLEVRLGTNGLSLFVSRWQLDHDRLPRPQPGDWIRGTFWFAARPKSDPAR